MADPLSLRFPLVLHTPILQSTPPSSSPRRRSTSQDTRDKTDETCPLPASPRSPRKSTRHYTANSKLPRSSSSRSRLRLHSSLHQGLPQREQGGCSSSQYPSQYRSQQALQRLARIECRIRNLQIQELLDVKNPLPTDRWGYSGQAD